MSSPSPPSSRLAPPPPSSQSAPPPPSSVSAPAPPTSVSAPAPAVTATRSIPCRVVPDMPSVRLPGPSSNPRWLPPRSMMPRSSPSPPSSDASHPDETSVSSPAPPSSRFAPAPPSSQSAPPPPAQRIHPRPAFQPIAPAPPMTSSRSSQRRTVVKLSSESEPAAGLRVSSVMPARLPPRSSWAKSSPSPPSTALSQSVE